MKKMYILLQFFLLFQTTQLLAQNSSPFWSLAGNSNATTTSKLGTTNSIPLRLMTNNVERMRLDVTGKIGIGTTTPTGKLSIQSSGSVPASLWVTSGVPIFAGFGENTAGNADDILAMASNTANARPVFLGRRARGTLALPTAVQNNDYLLSIFASGYDGGGNFQSPATLDFFVDGTVSSGKVPTRISLSTGSSFSDRTERLKVGSTGNIDMNNGQFFLDQATGNINIGAATVGYRFNVFTAGSYGLSSFAQYYPLYSVAQAAGGYGAYIVGGSMGIYTQGGDYGIYASANSPGYAGYFVGNVYCSGTYSGSDRKLKQNIEAMPSALDIIGKLQPRSYEYRHEGTFKAMNLPTGKHYGLIAQDVEAVLPNLVKDTKFESPKPPSASSGTAATKTSTESVAFKAVNYTELIPILVKGMQEQQVQIHQQDSVNKELQAQVAELQSQVAKLSGSSGSSVLKGSLSQNMPNPASGTSTVSYQVPSGTRQARIALMDNTGRLLQTTRVTGSGTIQLNTSTLASGVYHYSLIADDQVVETRQLLMTR